MPFETYLRKGLLKRRQPDFRQIEAQLGRAEKDLRTSEGVLDDDPEWGGAIAYHAMLRAGRALLFSRGYLPADGRQHKTVVELTEILLGRKYALLVKKFERMRRSRNLFFYETSLGSATEAESALETASRLIQVIRKRIRDGGAADTVRTH